MPIEPSSVPPGAITAVQRALVQTRSKSMFTSISRANARALSISIPHQIAYLPLDSIRRGLSLREGSRLGSWRFLVHEDRRNFALNRHEHVPIVAVTASSSPSGGYELGEVNQGPLVGDTEEAIRRAEALPEVRKGRSAALLLIAPAVHVVALWLRDLNGDADVLLALPSSHSALTPYSPTTSASFLATLQTLAQKVAPDSVSDG